MKATALRANIASLMSKVLGPPSKFETSQGRKEELSEFAVWSIQAGETDDIPAARLRILYAEFCEYTDTDPVSEAQFFKGLKAAGVERFREGGGQRRWLYKVRFRRRA